MSLIRACLTGLLPVEGSKDTWGLEKLPVPGGEPGVWPCSLHPRGLLWDPLSFSISQWHVKAPFLAAQCGKCPQSRHGEHARWDEQLGS